jgi:hypothetical protein
VRGVGAACSVDFDAAYLPTHCNVVMLIAKMMRASDMIEVNMRQDDIKR